jgi:tRNA(His) guanylyltransferase
VFQWRELDARKNAITMAASAHYSHKELLNKHSGDKLEMLTDKGVRFNDYPRHFRAGSYFKRVTVERELTPSELVKIPNKYWPADGKATRSEVQELDLQPLHLLSNPAEVLFGSNSAWAVEV